MTAAILTGLIFAVSLWLIFTEKINRTIAAIAGAVLIVGLGKGLGFYSETKALASIDFNTIGLLLGMMLLVALLEPSGVFQYLAVWAGRVSRGRPVWLLFLLGSITAALSMVLNNVTTVVLIAPITILICEILGIAPLPYLVTEALLSNVGGVATLVGDPPNILIASAAGYSFNDFLTRALPVVIVVWLSSLILLRFLLRKELAIQPANVKVLMQLNPSETITDRTAARRVLVILGTAVLLFFFHRTLNLSPAFISLAAAAAALVWVRPDFDDALHRVDWGLLIFFTSLFVMVGGLEAAGVLGFIVRSVAIASALPPMIFGILFIWVVAALSAVVDNVPITIALIPVIQGLGASGMDTGPLWWALVFGAGFGGNGTIIGSSATIVIANLSRKTHTPITAKLWNRRGLPVMLAACGVTSLLYVLLFPLFVH
ncbi:MAG TPA: ArsB/NhaD family transporter [Anaerolineales bacterium]